jgi:phenazine biosynthesis protein phzE
VVDEELKMMSRICGKGGVVRGPYLREMSALVHTEYLLDGSATMDPIEAFRESMYAATMVGSPLENAARVIHRHEPESRRYYSAALVLMGLGTEGDEYLDSAITIRTMEVTPDGHAVIRSGASIVRDSVPEKECLEVRAKAAGLLHAISSSEPAAPYLAEFVDEPMTQVLNARNEHLSRFWIDRQSGQVAADPHLVGRSVLLIDNEDQFTQMLKHVLEHQGLKTTICDYRDAEIDTADHDLVLVGPGPGDPNDLDHPKMARLHTIIADLLARKQPFLAVCLGHQVLCRTLGMTVAPVDPPLQGVQKQVDLFGRPERVGFYNTFFARRPETLPAGVELSAEPDGRVIALRAKDFYSFQFHVESVLTTNCVPILQEALTWLLANATR